MILHRMYHIKHLFLRIFRCSYFFLVQTSEVIDSGNWYALCLHCFSGMSLQLVAVGTSLQSCLGTCPHFSYGMVTQLFLGTFAQSVWKLLCAICLNTFLGTCWHVAPTPYVPGPPPWPPEQRFSYSVVQSSV